MKKYIQPSIEREDLLSICGLMLTISGEEGQVPGDSGAGDAKTREEIEQALDQQKTWEDGLW